MKPYIVACQIERGGGVFVQLYMGAILYIMSVNALQFAIIVY